MELYYFVQAAASVIRNSEVVRYSGVATVLYIWRPQLVHCTYNSVRYWVEVRYSECPLIESPLYFQIKDSLKRSFYPLLKGLSSIPVPSLVFCF